MREIHLYHHFEGVAELLARFDRLDATLASIEGAQQKMAHTAEELVALVQAQTTEVASVKTLVESLKAAVTAVPGIPADVQAKIDAVFDGITTNNATLTNLTTAVTTTPPTSGGPT